MILQYSFEPLYLFIANMFYRRLIRTCAAAAAPIAFTNFAQCDKPKQAKPVISNLSKYEDLILLPGSASLKLAENIATHLGVELGHLKTAR